VPAAAPEIGRQAKYIISDEASFVYFVVPKVACSSIKTALLSLFDLDAAGSDEPVREDDAPDLDVHRLFAGSGYQINKNQLARRMERGEFHEHFKFAFVRNPWDRLVSCYTNKIMDAKESEFGEPPFRHVPSEKGSRLYRGMPFAEFVETVCEIPDDESNMHFVSQYRVVCGPGEDRRIMADFVGRFENLAADFAVVAERIGDGKRLELPHKLRSESRKSRPYTEFYDDGLRDLVYERYRDDVEIFDYSFGDSRVPAPIWRGDGRAASGSS
jgi:chondroitin 4-sulfotransferase 11